NDIKGILPLQVRSINNEKRLYIDVTGKESILNYFNCHMATREEIKNLFEAIYVITDGIARFLIRETDVILRPEMIFRNLATGEYEFVCIPLKEDESENKNEGMKALLQFLMMHLDNTNASLVNAIYTISDMYEKGNPKFSLCYEYFTEETHEEPKEEVTNEEEVITEITTPRKKVYVPSKKEIMAGTFVVVGILLIGYYIFLSVKV
ncbi:MAG: hypothetical protein IK068_05700, partial [Lachnospiraceae bacterium]|nr:hypothetical protein [Lachnospiraceae bacterium]